eukprot:gene3491-6139_t
MKVLQVVVLLFIVSLCFCQQNDRVYTKPDFKIPEQKKVDYPSKPSDEFVSKIQIPKDQKTTSTTTKNSKKCSTQPICKDFRKVLLDNGQESLVCDSWENQMICETSDDKKKREQEKEETKKQKDEKETSDSRITDKFGKDFLSKDTFRDIPKPHFNQQPKDNNIYSNSFDQLPSSDLYSLNNGGQYNNFGFENQQDVDYLNVNDEYFFN